MSWTFLLPQSRDARRLPLGLVSDWVVVGLGVARACLSDALLCFALRCAAALLLIGTENFSLTLRYHYCRRKGQPPGHRLPVSTGCSAAEALAIAAEIGRRTGTPSSHRLPTRTGSPLALTFHALQAVLSLSLSPSLALSRTDHSRAQYRTHLRPPPARASSSPTACLLLALGLAFFSHTTLHQPKPRRDLSITTPVARVTAHLPSRITFLHPWRSVHGGWSRAC